MFSRPKVHCVATTAHPGDQPESGVLFALDSVGVFPFRPDRIFSVAGMARGARRGGHANLLVNEGICCLHGRLEVRTHDGFHETTHILSSPAEVLVIPAATWTDLEALEDGTAYFVLADHCYAEAAKHYVRDFSEFSRDVVAASRADALG